MAVAWMPSKGSSQGRYHHLSVEEREDVMCLRAEGRGVREIARRLGRPPSTASRELSMNGCAASGRRPHACRASAAHAVTSAGGALPPAREALRPGPAQPRDLAGRREALAPGAGRRLDRPRAGRPGRLGLHHQARHTPLRPRRPRPQARGGARPAVPEAPREAREARRRPVRLVKPNFRL